MSRSRSSPYRALGAPSPMPTRSPCRSSTANRSNSLWVQREMPNGAAVRRSKARVETNAMFLTLSRRPGDAWPMLTSLPRAGQRNAPKCSALLAGRAIDWLGMGAEGNTLLRLTDLTVDFASQEGTVHAVNRVSFEVAPGELVGLVGESGCGKSVTASAIIGLTRMVPNATVSGQIEFLDKDLLALPEAEVRAVRGRDISMIFQDPVTSLNPVLSIERLMTEGLELHLGMSHVRGASSAPSSCSARSASPGRQPHQGLPAPVQRRHAPARDDRHRAELQPQAAAGGRADDRARRHHPGADPAPAQEAVARARARPSSSSRTTWAWSPGCARGSSSCTPAASSRAARRSRSSPVRITRTRSGC